MSDTNLARARARIQQAFLDVRPLWRRDALLAAIEHDGSCHAVVEVCAAVLASAVRAKGEIYSEVLEQAARALQLADAAGQLRAARSIGAFLDRTHVADVPEVSQEEGKP